MQLIEKHHIDISCSNLDTAKLIQNEIGDVFQQNLYAKLDKLLEKYAIAERIWKIEKLKITIPNLVLSNWKNDLVNSILEQTEAFLKANQPQIKPTTANAEQGELVSLKRKYQELLVTYLIEGKLTPNAISVDLNQVYKAISIDEDFVSLFFQKLNESRQLNHSVLRIVFNLPDLIVSELAKIFDLESSFKSLDPVLKKHSKTSVEFFKYLLWKSCLMSKKTDTSLNFYRTHFNFSKKELIKEAEKWKSELKSLDLKNKKIISDELNKIESDISRFDFEPKTKDRKSTKNEIEYILEALQGNENERLEQDYTYINNAGIVILHPFLVPLFSQLGYLEDQKWKKERCRHRAVLLLHYLVYGESKVFENEVDLNKIICGVGISDTVNTKWTVTKAEKEKCQELLLSVIEHWSILKDTSVSTLQQTFLQRHGKLTEYKKGQYELVVEQKSIDMLLDHLPWGIRTVKTPWMDNYLTCQWA
jgi:uncharacterized glyoxalase superfamily protein PhnB